MTRKFPRLALKTHGTKTTERANFSSRLKNCKTKLRRKKTAKNSSKKRPKKLLLRKSLKMKDPVEAVEEAEVVVDEVVVVITVAIKKIVLARWVVAQDQQLRQKSIDPVQSSKPKTTAHSTRHLPDPNPRRQNKSRPIWS